MTLNLSFLLPPSSNHCDDGAEPPCGSGGAGDQTRDDMLVRQELYQVPAPFSFILRMLHSLVTVCVCVWGGVLPLLTHTKVPWFSEVPRALHVLKLPQKGLGGDVFVKCLPHRHEDPSLDPQHLCKNQVYGWYLLAVLH